MTLRYAGPQRKGGRANEKNKRRQGQISTDAFDADHRAMHTGIGVRAL